MRSLAFVSALGLALAACSGSPDGARTSTVSTAALASSSAAVKRPSADVPPWPSMRVMAFDDVGGVTVSDDAGDFRPWSLERGLQKFGWSPDGAALVGARADGTIVRCELSESAAASPCRAMFSFPDAWRLRSSPGGARFLGVPSQGKDAWVIDASTGERHATPAREGAWIDDRRIAYFQYPDKRLRVWDASAERDELVSEPLDLPEIRALVAAPDATRIAVVTRKPVTRDASGIVDSYYGLAILDARTGARVSTFESAEHPSGPDASPHGEPPVWSPGSERLAYVDEGAIVVLEGPGLAARRLDTKAMTVLGWLDDRRVAYVVIDHVDDSMVRKYGHGLVEQFLDLLVVDVDSGATSKLTQGGALRGIAFTRSPSR